MTPRRHWTGLPARHPRVTLLLAGVVLLLCALSLSRMRPDPSLARMFPRDNPAARSLLRVVDHFSAVEELLVLVSVPEAQRTDPPDTARLLDFATRLERAVAESPESSKLTAGVLYRADEQSREFFEKVLVPHALFYLDDATFEAAQQRLTRDAMVEQVRQNEALVATPGPAGQALAKAFLQDPLRLHEFVASRLLATRPFKTYDNSDAFLSPDGHSLLIRVRGTRPPADVDFSTSITDTISRLAKTANTDNLDVRLTGAYAIAATSAGAIRADMISNITSTVICIQVLFVLAYRRPFRSFALSFLPVAAGVVAGLGVYTAFSPSLTPLTAVIGGILAGMGIDYSLHYLSHFMAARAGGFGSAADAAAESSALLAGPTLGAWITSIIGFAAVALSPIPALRDFALLGTIGLAGTLVATFTILPALLVILSRSSLKKEPSRSPHRLPLEPLLLIATRRPTLIVSMVALVLIASVIVVARPGPVIPLESDLTAMHPSPNPALEAQSRLAERMGAAADTLMIHLEADSSPELQALAHQVDARLRSPLAREAGVASTFGLAALLPDPTVAPTRLTAIGPAVADRVVGDFHAAVSDSVFAPEAFEPYSAFLRHTLTRTSAPTIADLLPYRRLAETILPTASVDAGAAPTDAITHVFLRDPLTTRESRDRAISAIRTLLADVPGATLTGMPVLAHDTERTVRRDLPRFFSLAMAAVAVYLLVHFRSASQAILALLPTLFSLVVLLAAARLAGQKLNLINLVAVPILIGINVDYGIYLVSLARTRPPGETLEAFVRRITPSAHAILLCAATTVLGFGSLYFTSVPAIQSLGFGVAVGLIACTGATFGLLLPILAKSAPGSGIQLTGPEISGSVPSRDPSA